jgi:hypothetical protein
LEYPEFAERLGSFLQRLNNDPALLQTFARDPSGVLSPSVFPDDPQPALSTINRGNRLLFSLLSNERFMTWSEQYTERLSASAVERFPDLDADEAARAFAATLSPDEVYQEIVDAMVQFVDRELLAALLVVDPDDVDSLLGREAARAPSPVYGWVVVLVLLFVVVAAVHAVVALGTSGDVIRTGAIPGLSREDLGRINRLMLDAMSERARGLRETGVLASTEAARRGTSL